MTRLPEILLRNLKLDRLIGFFQSSEQRRGWFAHLKIDGAVLDLHHHVRFEFSIQRPEIVVGGASAVILRIPPVHVVVVNEAPVEEQAAVRLAAREPPRSPHPRASAHRPKVPRAPPNRL